MDTCPATGHPDFTSNKMYAALFRVTSRLQREVLKLHLEYKYGELSALHMGTLGTLRKYKLLSASELADKLVISRPQMTALLDKLENRNLVQRSPDPEDRRRLVLSLTDEGQKTLAEAIRQQETQLTDKMGNLDAADMAEMEKTLLAMERLLDKMQTPRALERDLQEEKK